MFRPSLRSLHWLLILSVFGLILFYFAQTSYQDVQSSWFEEKTEAANLMQECISIIKEESKARGYEIDPTNDPNQTGVIGVSVSPITTSAGILSDKLTALNPNMSAAMIDLLKKANVKKNDKVAVGLTGANPAANIAMYAALEVIGARPVIITSVGASQFGANRPDFTWLDIETLLYNKKKISFKSVAASLGGGKDLGRGISKEGRGLIEEAVIRNEIELIKEPSLNQNIDKRMKIYASANSNSRYSTFINIGSGLANVGNSVNAKLVYNGLNSKLADKNFATKGAMMKFADKSTKIIHVNSITKIAERYRLPIDPEPLPKAGTGDVFVTQKNNVVIASVCLALLIIAIVLVVVLDRSDRHYTSNIVDDPDKAF